MVSRVNVSSLLVAFLFCISMVVGSGINVGALSLVIFSLLFVWKKSQYFVDAETKTLLWTFGVYFALFLLSMLLFDEKAKILDRPSRVLLAIPVLLVLLRYTPKLKIVNVGIVIGAIGACVSGVILYFYFNQTGRVFVGLPEKFGLWHEWSKGFMPIQSGDMGLSLGIFSFIVAIYYYKQQRYLGRFIALCGFMAGVVASILSGSRGGWVCIPGIMLVIIFLNKKHLKFFIGIFCLMLLLSVFSGKSLYHKVQKRLDSINTELTRENSSSGIRVQLWKDAILTFKENPIFGVGGKARTENRIEHKNKKLVTLPKIFNEEHAHNQYLEVLSLRGLVGFASLLMLFLWPLWVFIKRLKQAKNLSFNERITQETVCQLGISHILLVMGYCMTQAFLEHNSGIVFYSIVLVCFFAMSSRSDNTECRKV